MPALWGQALWGVDLWLVAAATSGGHSAPILRISDRGGGNAVVVAHARAAISWVMNGPGSFACVLAAADARSLGAYGDNWKGAKWVEYAHPDLPVWGGIVTAPRWTLGLFEPNAESFHVLARKRRVPRTYGQQSATAGALAQRAMSDVQSDDDPLLLWGGADETGEAIDYTWRGGDLHDDVWRELAQASGQEFTVDADRLVYWRTKLGSDKTGSVLLAREIINFDFSADLWTMANDVEGTAADTKFADSAYDQLDDETSIRAYGRYQMTIRYPRVVTKGTLRPKLKADLNRLKNGARVATLRTANVNHSWAKYHLGDTITVVLPDAGVVAEVRIVARAIDADSGIETLGVTVEAIISTPQEVAA